jgi:hypothetical protein
MVWGAYMRELVADRQAQRFPAPDPITTRAPKMLVMPGERPPPDPAPTPVFELPFVSTTLPGTVEIPFPDFTPSTIFGSGRVTIPSIPDYFTPPPTIGEQDDTPRTSRTSRPPRPRDTTIPDDE